MESSRACQRCRKNKLLADGVTGNTYCSDCGLVQDYDNFQAFIGGIDGPTGTFIRHGTAGSGTVNTYKETKIYHAQELIKDLMYKLGISDQKAQDVKALVEEITEGEYGQGEWFPIFVGACAYVVRRKDQNVLPIVEVAHLVGCDVYELGRMITRVVNFTGMKLPEFNIVNAFEQSIKMCCRSFGNPPADVVQRMLKQGVFLVQCLIKWFITTGRTPMPVVAAVLVFVSELNELDWKIEDVAVELHVTVSTCRRRYKELLERLVEVARVLPWGEDVTVKNILKNAPFVIQYMEMKSMKKDTGEGLSIERYGLDMEGLIEECLSKRIGYGFDSYNNEDCSSVYFEGDSSSTLAIDYQDKYQVTPECLTMIYANYLDEVSLVKASVEAEAGIVSKRKKISKTFDLEACTDWWRGKSDLSKKLILKEVLEKDVGLDAMPPSFDRGCLAKAKRQDKIKATKLRIQRMMHPRIANSNELCLVEPEKPKKKKRKKLQVETDWEDLIIETLLLHNVKDEEIEKGHYKVLLALHVFNDGIA